MSKSVEWYQDGMVRLETVTSGMVPAEAHWPTAADPTRKGRPLPLLQISSGASNSPDHSPRLK